ncbi:MAG: hypothetical protein QXI07_11060, partial [Pyrobaculum sp.]
GRYNYFNPDWSDVCADGGFAGRRPEELSWDVYEAASAPVRLVVGGLEHLLAWAAVHGLNVRETTRLLRSFGFDVVVERVDRRGGVVSFVLSNGSVVYVPVFFEVQSNGTGLFVVGNPSFVGVSYLAVVRFKGEKEGLEFNLSAAPLEGVVAVPVVMRQGDKEYEVSLFLYAPPGNYSLGNFSVVFNEPRLVAGNRSILLRPLHAVFLPAEVRRLVDAVDWCNRRFWRGFDEVSDSYDYALLGEVALTVIPVGRVAGLFGKLLGAGARAFEEVRGVVDAVKSAYYALSTSKWARAVGTGSGFVISDVFIAEDLRRLLEPQAAEEVFSAFGVDLAEVESFHAGVLTDSSCFHAGRYYAAVYVTWAQRVSAAVDLASNLYAKVSKDALEKFGRSFVGVAGRAKRFDHANHAVYIAARAWGPVGVKEDEWNAAVERLASELGEGNVAAVVQLSRMGVFVEKEGKTVAEVVAEFKEKKYRERIVIQVVARSIEGREGGGGRYYLAYDEEGGVGGGFVFGFGSDRSFYRWTNYGLFNKLVDEGLVTFKAVKVGRGEVSVRGFRSKYVCVEVSISYASELVDDLRSFLSVGAWSQWQQRFASLGAFSALEHLGVASFVQYAYEVDIDPKGAEPVDGPLVLSGLAGYLEPGRPIYGVEAKFIHLKGTRLVSPDGVALSKDGVYLLEVGRELNEVIQKFFRGSEDKNPTVGALLESGLLSTCKEGICLTNRGVALLGFRTDAVAGATVGAVAKGEVSDKVLAYPQIKTALTEWAGLLGRSPPVRLVFGVYTGGDGQYGLRLMVFERITGDFNTAEKAAIKAWNNCWKG